MRLSRFGSSSKDKKAAAAKDSNEMANPQTAGAAAVQLNDDLLVGEFLEDGEGERASMVHHSSELREWLTFVSRVEFETVIGDVEVRRRKYIPMNKKPMYGIRTKKISTGDVFNTKRSIREFRRLEQALKSRFVGILLPPLPKGKINTTVLDLFVQEISRNPVITSDAAYQQFYKPNVQKFTKKVVEELGACSDGISNWEQMLDSVPLPNDTFSRLRDVGKEIVQLQGVHAKLKEYVKKLHGHMQRSARDQREVQVFYSKWRAKEANQFPLLFGRCSDLTGGCPELANGREINVPDMLKSMAAISEHRADTMTLEAGRMLEEALKSLIVEFLYLGQLSSMTSEVKAEVRKHNSAMANLANLRNQLEANWKKSSGSSFKSAATSSFKSTASAPPALAPTVSEEDERKENGDNNDNGGGTDDVREEATAVPVGDPTVSPTSAKLPKGHSRVVQKAENLESMIKTRQFDLKRRIRGLLFEVDRYRFERTARYARLFNLLAQVQRTHLDASASVCAEAIIGLPGVPPPVAHLTCYTRFHDRGSLASPAAQQDIQIGFSDRLSPLGDAQDESFAAAPARTQVQKPLGQGQSQRSSSRVLYDFEAEAEGEVSLQEGQVVEMLESPYELDQGWSTVRTPSGLVGLVPTDYLENDVVVGEEGYVDECTDDDDQSSAPATSAPNSPKSANLITAIPYDEPTSDQTTPRADPPPVFGAPVAENDDSAGDNNTSSTVGNAVPATAKPSSLLAAIQGFDKSNLGKN